MSTLIDHCVAQAAIHYVCDEFGITKDELLSRARPERIAWPRQVAMAIAWEESDLTLYEVAIHFNRGFGAVAFGARHVRDRVDAYPKTDGQRVRRLREKVKNERFG